MRTVENDPLGIIKKPPVRIRQSGKQTRLPGNVRFRPRTKWMEQSNIEGEVPSWENLRHQQTGLRTDRLPELTAAELHYIEYLQQDWEWLRVKKAQELKPCWAAGYTARECANEYGNTFGYRMNTIKKYWALFNKELSPTEQSGEGS